MDAFAAEVGDVGPLAVLGGGTRGHVGGRVSTGTRMVRAPAGIRCVRARELTVTVGAGTQLAELEIELLALDQRVALSGPAGATVGGCIAVGHGGLDALGLGPVRDSVLGISAVDSWGNRIEAGGRTVKNVSGFDLCRLFTGSLGTLALIGEVTLRTRPVWPADIWVQGRCDPGAALGAAPGAACILFDGHTTWAHLVGHRSDIDRQLAALAHGGCSEQIDGPPQIPSHRSSIDPAHIGSLEPGAHGGWVAEVGVGVLHTRRPAAVPPMPRRLHQLNAAVKSRFDPTGRLNPGRSPLHGVGIAP